MSCDNHQRPTIYNMSTYQENSTTYTMNTATYGRGTLPNSVSWAPNSVSFNLRHIKEAPTANEGGTGVCGGRDYTYHPTLPTKNLKRGVVT